MIDLHTHTFLSDGVLSVSELVYREKLAGYSAVAITDHVDFSNIEFVIGSVKKGIKSLEKAYGIKVIPGAELTYVPPNDIGDMIKKARDLGAQIVIVHGETTAENVPPGTNKAAILGGADILAHPGNISIDDVKLARDKNVCLEITSRRGHKDTNKWVAKCAKDVDAKLIFSNDAHGPEDIITKDRIIEILKEAGLRESDYEVMLQNARELID